MLGRVSECIVQLDQAEKAGAADTKIAGTISLGSGITFCRGPAHYSRQ
jgi:hypothetical protein